MIKYLNPGDDMLPEITPGPWGMESMSQRYRNANQSDPYYVCGDITAGVNGHGDGPQHTIVSGTIGNPADASLIVNAPEVLAALQGLVNAANAIPSDGRTAELRLAIAAGIVAIAKVNKGLPWISGGRIV